LFCKYCCNASGHTSLYLLDVLVKSRRNGFYGGWRIEGGGGGTTYPRKELLTEGADTCPNAASRFFSGLPGDGGRAGGAGGGSGQAVPMPSAHSRARALSQKPWPTLTALALRESGSRQTWQPGSRAHRSSSTSSSWSAGSCAKTLRVVPRDSWMY